MGVPGTGGGHWGNSQVSQDDDPQGVCRIHLTGTEGSVSSMFSTFFWWYRDVFLMSDEMFLIVWSLFTMSLTVDFYSSTTYFSAKISVGK